MSSTQVRRPWRAVVRTAFQLVVALAALLPFVVEAAEIPSTVPAVAAVLVVAGAITRVMALPQVDAFLERFVPWLASDPGEDPEPSGPFAVDVDPTDRAYHPPGGDAGSIGDGPRGI